MKKKMNHTIWVMEVYFTDLSVTKDQKWFVITTCNKEYTEIWVKDRQNENSEFVCIFKRSLKFKAFCNHAENSFYLLTNMDNVYDLKIVKLEDQNIQS